MVVLWFWGWGNEHHNAWRRQLSRDLARASSWEAGCHCCCIAGTRGVRSSLSVVSRVIRRRNADKGAEVKACWRRRPVGCLWALSARLDALPGRVVSGCCVALVSVVAGDDICVKVSTSCCECSVSVQDGNTFASVELLMPLHPATFGTRSGVRTSESKSCAGEDMLPEHLRAMYDNAKKRLSTEQAEKLCTILVMFADVFAKNDLDLGKFTAIVHRIRTGESLPIKAGLRRTPLGFESAERATLDSMLGAGVIEPSQSEFAAAPVLVRKRDKSWRYCIDYRALNSGTIRDVYPLPLIEECIDCLAGKK